MSVLAAVASLSLLFAAGEVTAAPAEPPAAQAVAETTAPPASDPAAPPADAAAPPADAAAPAEPPAEANNRGKQLCKVQQVTGSRTRKTRICATAEEWEARAAAERDTVNRIIDRTTATKNPGG